MPVLDGTAEKAREGVARGGYVLADPPAGDPQAILIASGSEVALCVAAQQQLAESGIAVRVVSLPSWELFEAQDRRVPSVGVAASIPQRLAVEAGVPLGWERYTGNDGDILGIDGFGGSAPYKDLAEKYGFTVDNVVQRVLRLIKA